MDYSSNTIVIDDSRAKVQVLHLLTQLIADATKVLIDARDLGLTGVEFEKITPPRTHRGGACTSASCIGAYHHWRFSG